MSYIPEGVAVCPECGGRLTLREAFDAGECEPPSIECLEEDDDGGFHRWWQSDWQPVIDAVDTYLRGEEGT